MPLQAADLDSRAFWGLQQNKCWVLQTQVLIGFDCQDNHLIHRWAALQGNYVTGLLALARRGVKQPLGVARAKHWKGSVGRWRRCPRAKDRRKMQMVGGGALRSELGQRKRPHNRWTGAK